MRILGLAKELGIPYERLLEWCRESGLPYNKPDDEIMPGHSRMARAAFSRSILGDQTSDVPVDELIGDWMDDTDLDEEGFPKNLEELEALERSIFKSIPLSAKKKSKAKKVSLSSILTKYGLEGKNTIKKIKRLLPEHVSRLLNHEELVDEHAALLQESLEQKIFFTCGDKSCDELLERRHGKEKLVSTRNSSVCCLCHGSSVRRDLEEMAEVCKEAGIHRILVIGGSPVSHKELKSCQPSGLEFRLIEGDVNRDKRRASADLRWCDLAVLWAGTLLGHEVSNQYARSKKTGHSPFVVIHRGSVGTLCNAVIQHVRSLKGG